jgi:hypothetical protein
MKLYAPKNLNFGFVILCPEHNVTLLQITAKSIKGRYPDSPIVCAVDESATKQDLDAIKQICSVAKGKQTFSSLINAGVAKIKSEWIFFVCAGAIVTSKIIQRFSLFVESEKDVLFPIANNKFYFPEATLNGLFLNKSFFKDIGPWEETGNLEFVKILWALKAIEKGCKFKSISNSKIC